LHYSPEERKKERKKQPVGKCTDFVTIMEMVQSIFKKSVLHGVNTDWALEFCVLRKFVLGYESYHLRTGTANVAQLLINTVSGVAS
jgi:hypothetical protein